MGWHFDLKHANTVAYVTATVKTAPPRLTAWQLREFLGSLQGEYRDRPPLISTDTQWIDEVTSAAKRAAGTLVSRRVQDDSLLDGDTLEYLLKDLRSLLSRYELFGLTVGTRNDRDQLNAFAEHAAYSSKHPAPLLDSRPAWAGRNSGNFRSSSLSAQDRGSTGSLARSLVLDAHGLVRLCVVG